MKKKGFTDYWLSFAVEFQTDVITLMIARKRCRDKEKHGLFTQWNNRQQLENYIHMYQYGSILEQSEVNIRVQNDKPSMLQPFYCAFTASLKKVRNS